MIMEKYNVGTSNLDPHQFVEIEFYFREIVFLLSRTLKHYFKKLWAVTVSDM